MGSGKRVDKLKRCSLEGETKEGDGSKADGGDAELAVRLRSAEKDGEYG